jgi:S1-C subfamily serine protease
MKYIEGLVGLWRRFKLLDNKYLMYFLIALIGIMAAYALSLKTDYKIKVKMIVQPRVIETLPSHVIDSTITIRTPFGFGSGVVVSKHFILSAAHLLATPPWENDEAVVEVEIRHHELQVNVWTRATIAKVDKESDLLLLFVPIELPHAISTIATNDMMNAGDKLYVVGYPYGASAPNCSDGRLTAKFNNHNEDAPFLWHCSAPAFPGNSGGPVFLAKTGELIGILVRVPIISENILSNNVSYFVPWDRIVNFVGPQGN